MRSFLEEGEIDEDGLAEMGVEGLDFDEEKPRGLRGGGVGEGVGGEGVHEDMVAAVDEECAPQGEESGEGEEEEEELELGGGHDELVSWGLVIGVLLLLLRDWGGVVSRNIFFLACEVG